MSALIPLVSLLLFASAGAITYVFIFGFLWGAGYYPTPRKEIEFAGELLDIQDGSLTYDLGCGFGKVIFLLAQEYPSARFVGVEIDPLKYLWCKLAIKRKKLHGRVNVLRRSLLQVDLSMARGVFVFLSGDTAIMEKLRAKIFKEMPAGSRVVTHIHKFQHWEEQARKGNVRLYVVPGS